MATETKSAAHTPGPWVRDGQTGGVVGLRIANERGEAVAYVKGEANARLIAAAPLLLKVLQDAGDVIALLAINCCDRVDVSEDPRLTAICAAIAAATGTEA